MKIACIGGGPAGLYAAILFAKAFPQASISVVERNGPDDTFGWGVVFSDETLSHFERADAESFAAIRRSFISWTDIETFRGGTRTVSTGHGFVGLSRKTLLQILHARARELGVELSFRTEVPSTERFRDADLVVAADGVNSRVREQHAAAFRPSLDWRQCKFCWLGTTKTLRAFTFVFKDTPHGLFQVHAYPFEPGLGTWIVECREEVWKRAGLDRADEAATVAFCQELFAEELGGESLLVNRSLWRTFPTVSCGRWSDGNVVLLGDAAHTAHFSIGSGTKLAMEDAITLVSAFEERGWKDVPGNLAAWEEARRPDVIRLQKAAQTSLEWFENSARYAAQPPLQFTFNLMTRSKRITFDNLRVRDPALVDAAAEEFRAGCGAPKASDGSTPPPIFTPFRARGVTLPNRIVVSPMCQYSAVDGTADDWHLVHLGSRAIGGAGLVIAEMTDVEREGRITEGCAGMYSPEHVPAWRRVTDFVHRWTQSKIGVQLAHAGRKGSTFHPWARGGDEPLREKGWTTLAPSPIPFQPDWPAPKEMTRADLDRVRDAFALGARRAREAGFDWIELHMAHGYLLAEFISPLTNRRRDAYGGGIENRMRFPLEVFAVVREAWPDELPISARISATDWVDEGGVDAEEAVAIANLLKSAGCDLIDVSTGGTVPDAKVEFGRMYQVPFADRIRHEAQIPVMSVGAILGWDHANTVILSGRADLALLARPHLYDPYLTLHAASAYGYPDAPWPPQYLSGRDSRPDR